MYTMKIEQEKIQNTVFKLDLALKKGKNNGVHMESIPIYNCVIKQNAKFYFSPF